MQDVIERGELVARLKGAEHFAEKINGVPIITYDELYLLIGGIPGVNAGSTFADGGGNGAIQRYALENLRHMSVNAMQEFDEFITKHGISDDLMRLAIDKACDTGARSWSYVAGILYNWLDRGLATVEDVRADDQRRRRDKRNGVQQTQPNPALNYQQRETHPATGEEIPVEWWGDE